MPPSTATTSICANFCHDSAPKRRVFTLRTVSSFTCSPTTGSASHSTSHNIRSSAIAPTVCSVAACITAGTALHCIASHRIALHA